MDESFFRARYDADSENAKRQTWDKYRDWVRKFYEGTRFPPVKGWDAQTQALLERIDAGAQADVTARVNKLGSAIASEWAKDNAVRRISTSDLQGWGRELEKAASKDAAALLATIERLDGDIIARAK